jgi:hypothetical protein
VLVLVLVTLMVVVLVRHRALLPPRTAGPRIPTIAAASVRTCRVSCLARLFR